MLTTCVTTKKNLMNLIKFINVDPSNHDGFRNYLGEIFNNFNLYAQHSNLGVTFNTLKRFIQLPLIISEHLMELFDINLKGYLLKDEFVQGLFTIYAGNLAEKEKLAFDLLDLNKDGLVEMEDIYTIFCQFHILINESPVSMLEDLMKCWKVTQFTRSKWEEFNKKNSDILMMLFCFISRFKPFDEETIHFLSKFQKRKKKSTFKFSIIPDEDNKFINNFADSSEAFMDYCNINFKTEFFYTSEEDNHIEEALSYLEEFENDKKSIVSKFIMDENLEDEQNMSEFPLGLEKPKAPKLLSVKYHSRFSQKSTQNSNSEVYKNASLEPKEKINQSGESSFISNSLFPSTSKLNIPQIIHPSSKNLKEPCELILAQIDVYLTFNSNFSKFLFVLVKEDIFCLQYSHKKSKKFKFISVYNIRIYTAYKSQQVILSKKEYSSFILDSNSNYQSHPLCFYCENKQEMEKFVRIVRAHSWKQDLNDYYDVLGTIGKGHFGQVHLAYNKLTGEKVAIKALLRESIKESHMKMVDWEIEIFQLLKKIKHPGIIRSIDSFEDEKTIFLVFEYMPDGNLEKYVFKEMTKLTSNDVLYLIYQLASALQFLHQLRIFHRDLKPQNILLCKGEDGLQIKLIDFGLSRVLGKGVMVKENSCSIYFASPEVLRKSSSDFKADVWSFGVIVFFLRYGVLPFEDKSKTLKKLVVKIISGKYTYPNSFIPTSIDEEINRVISKCLTVDQKSRATIDQVIERKCFRQFTQLELK